MHLLAIGTPLKSASVSFIIILHVLLSVGQADEWNDPQNDRTEDSEPNQKKNIVVFMCLSSSHPFNKA